MKEPNGRDSALQSRRQFMMSALALVATASASSVAVAVDHHHSHHHASHAHEALIDSALHCIREAQFCRDHCIELIKTGDTTLIDCLDIVTDTISICEALVQLSVSNNRHLKSFAKVCIEICKDCEAECRLHKDKHEACKRCMESCIGCIEELEKVAA